MSSMTSKEIRQAFLDYFAGQGQLPVAMTGSVLFVLLGGLAFDLARRRSK